MHVTVLLTVDHNNSKQIYITAIQTKNIHIKHNNHAGFQMYLQLHFEPDRERKCEG